MKKKIAISISGDILKQVDDNIDWNIIKNRSSSVESILRKWLNLKDDIWALIIAHDNNWDAWFYPLDVPKVLIKVDWKTLLEKHLESIKNANIKKVIISVWHEKDQIIDFIKNKNLSLEVEFLDVSNDDLSLSIISKAKKILSTNKVLTILWDNYFYPLDLTDFISYHNSNKKDISIVVKNVTSTVNNWNLKIQWNDIIEFNERLSTKDDISNLVNAWIYLIDSNVIPEVWKNLKIESDFFPYFVKNKKVKAYFHYWKWFHIQSDKVLNLFK